MLLWAKAAYPLLTIVKVKKRNRLHLADLQKSDYKGSEYLGSCNISILR